MRARTRSRNTAQPSVRRGVWVVVSIVVLLVAAIVVSTYALGHARGEAAATPEPSGATSPTTAAASPEPGAATPATTSAEAPAPTAPATPSAPAPTVPPATPSPSPASTTVAIVTSGWQDGAVRVSGYATVIEDGGTCTLALTRGDVTVTGSRAASTDATTTSCGVVELRDPRLTAGTWQAVLTYFSATSTGTSPPTSITIG